MNQKLHIILNLCYTSRKINYSAKLNECLAQGDDDHNKTGKIMASEDDLGMYKVFLHKIFCIKFKV